MRRRPQKRPPNQVVGGDSFFKPRVQAKLAMGTPGDKYEVEADHMADQVVNKSSSDGAVQKMEGEEEVQQKPLADSITSIQRMETGEEEPMQAMEEEESVQAMEEEESVQAMEEEESVQAMEEEESVQAMEEEESVQAMEEEESVQAMEEEESVQAMEEEESVQAMEEEESIQAMEEEESVQAKANSTNQVSESTENQIRNSGSGSKMDTKTRTEMEQGFGANFSNVRIHTDSTAVQMNKDMGAQAFTHGNDVYFNEGKYNPNSSQGKHLLAHELTHTVQQGKSVPINYIQQDLAVEPPNPDAEAVELIPEEIQDAINYNQRRFTDEAELRNLRDVLGLSPEPAVINESFVETVVQWQAENNLDQDGKIGPNTARVIGKEMREESSLDPTQRPFAKAMLERGIKFYFTGNSYTDGANTSQKVIQFNVSIPRGLNLRDYALVQFVKGQILRMPGPANPNARMYGVLVPLNFPNWQVDSVDPDPIYWSEPGTRWDYNTNGRTFSATDDVGRDNHVFNPGDSADLDFKIGVYRISDLPATTTGNIGGAQPIVMRRWSFSVARDLAGNITHP